MIGTAVDPPPLVPAGLLAASRRWKASKEDSAHGVDGNRGGPLRDYVRSRLFELTVPAPLAHDARMHAQAYQGLCHEVMQADRRRMDSFSNAIAKVSAGRVVLDL